MVYIAFLNIKMVFNLIKKVEIALQVAKKVFVLEKYLYFTNVYLKKFDYNAIQTLLYK